MINKKIIPILAIECLEKQISNNITFLSQHRECLTAPTLCDNCQFLMDVNEGLRAEIKLLSKIKA